LVQLSDWRGNSPPPGYAAEKERPYPGFTTVEQHAGPWFM